MTESVTAPDSVRMTVDDCELREALAVANIPTLLMVLRQFTADPQWLEDPYRPTRTMAIDDNDSGGLPEHVREDVRSQAFDVIREWRDGVRPDPKPPTTDEIIDLLSVSLGDLVPAEYATTMAEEAGFQARAVDWAEGRPVAADALRVVIIGAGPAGIAAAATLQRLGIRYTVIEKEKAPGGVWWKNTYPGAGVDTPTHLYSYAFAPKRSWSRYYAKQAEILEYFQEVARDLDLVSNMRLETEVVSTEWDEPAKKWNVTVRGADGSIEHIVATAVISCVGVLSQPSVPVLDGAPAFRGTSFHSSNWDHNVDLTDLRVAVIGTGATAQQIVPAIAGKCRQVSIYQRTPQWMIPNENYSRLVDPRTRLLMEQVPLYAALYRTRLIWMFQDKLLAALHRDPDWPHPERSVNEKNERHRVFLTSHVDGQLDGRDDLRDRVLPNYPPYAKRILIDNGWIQTVKRDDVELISQGIDHLEADGIVTEDGVSHPADLVVYATGFQASRMLWPIDVRGRDGVALRDVWGDADPFAYLGICVPGFPNFFIVGGPNTALGHGGSFLYTIECCIAYIAQLLISLVEGERSALEVRQEVSDAYVRRVDEAHERLIWTHPGISTWYRNHHGRVTITTPWRGVDFWGMTRKPDLADFV